MLMYIFENCQVDCHQNKAMTFAETWTKTQPPRKKIYRVSVQKLEELRHQLDDLLAARFNSSQQKLLGCIRPGR